MPAAKSAPRTRETSDAPLVDWLALDDDTWRAVGAFLKGLDVYAMRGVCAAFRKRIFPLADVPAGARLALRLALLMKRLDHYPTPEGVTPHNLLAYKYNSYGMHKGLYPPRSNAGQTVDALLKAPLGDLCAAVHALREARPRLRMPFSLWLDTGPVRLALRNRCIPLKTVRTMEHCVGCLRRELTYDEFCAGVRLFYELDMIQQTPTYVELCQFWWALAFHGYWELLQWLWDKQEDSKFDGYTTIRRRQSLLTWRNPLGHNVLQAAEKGWEARLRMIDREIGPNSETADPVAHAAGVEQSKAIYKPIIAWVRQLRQFHLMPFQLRDDCPFQPEDMWMDEDSGSG